MHSIPTARRILRARAGLLQRLFAALSLYRQRQHLGRLDAHMLRDIGLTAEQARAEADLPIWHPPHHWVQRQP